MKMLYLASVLVILLTIGGMCYVIYESMYPFQVAKVFYEQNPLVNSTLHRGDPIAYKVDVEHFTEGVVVDVTRELRCGEDVLSFAPISYTTHKNGREQFINSTLTVPMRTPLGTCHVISDGHFHLSPFRTIDFVTRTADFEVVN